jgi:hypothetical protein
MRAISVVVLGPRTVYLDIETYSFGQITRHTISLFIIRKPTLKKPTARKIV